MKQIVKILIIFGLLTMILPATALADMMAKDDFMAVSCGGFHTLALRNNGDLWAWGANEHGQVGNGGQSGSESISIEGGLPCQAQPVLVLEDVTAIAAGGWHSMAITADGSLWGWGMNDMGQLGNGGVGRAVLSPQKIRDNVVAVAAGDDFTLALTTNGDLLSCGSYNLSQLGSGGGISQNSQLNDGAPIIILTEVKSMAAGGAHVLALRNDGSLWAWGLNQQGQIGNGKSGDDQLYQTEPLQIFESGVASIAAYGNHSLAIMEDGALWGWGDNSGQQLLESEKTVIATPQMLFEGATYSEAGFSRTFVLKNDYTLWGWGDNLYQALNFNYKADYLSGIPKQILDNVTNISSGAYHSMAVKEDGTLWGWGNNDSGQLAQEPGAVGLPVRVKVEYPAWAEEPDPEPEDEEIVEPEEAPLEEAPEQPSPLPFIIGCGILGLGGGVGGGLFYRHLKKQKGTSPWRG